MLIAVAALNIVLLRKVSVPGLCLLGNMFLQYAMFLQQAASGICHDPISYAGGKADANKWSDITCRLANSLCSSLAAAAICLGNASPSFAESPSASSAAAATPIEVLSSMDFTTADSAAGLAPIPTTFPALPPLQLPKFTKARTQKHVVGNSCLVLVLGMLSLIPWHGQAPLSSVSANYSLDSFL